MGADIASFTYLLRDKIAEKGNIPLAQADKWIAEGKLGHEAYEKAVKEKTNDTLYFIDDVI